MALNDNLNSKHILLFGENTKAYSIHRPKYPNLLFETIAKNIVGKKQLAIDIGAGTGIASIQLAKYFDTIIAVEPDAKLASFIKNEIKNKQVQVVEGDFNSVNKEIREVDMINCSASIHWLNINEFFKKAEFFLRIGGAICINTPNIFPVFEKDLQQEISSEFNEVWIKHCHSKLDCIIDLEILEKRIANNLNFSEPIRAVFENKKLLKIEEVIGFFSTLSYFNSYINMLNRMDQKKYFKKIEEILEKHSENGMILVNFQIHSFQLFKQ